MKTRRNVRMYGLFERQNGKWVRLYPTMAFRKDVAVRLFQNALLAGVFGGKDVKGERKLAPVAKRCWICGEEMGKEHTC